QDYDLLLRVVEKTQAIRRIPRVLYHWRAAAASTAAGVKVKPYAVSAAKRAIAEHLARRGLDAEVLDGDALGSYRVKYRVLPGQRVCIIVPTRDKVHLLERCVSSVLAKTSHDLFTILIVDNRSREPETLAYFDRIKEHPKVRVARYDQPFNFSAINNFAVRGTDSDYLVFLNNDTEVIGPEWLDAMLEFAQRDDVGAVGAKLYYPNDTIQHAGTIVGYWGVADHAHKHYARSARGYMGRINIIQNLTAVTAACMMMRRKVFDEVGGYDEAFSHSFNDVDLCLRIRDKGYLVVYTPYAELYHHESVSRGHDEKPGERARLDREIALMKARWKRVFDAGDPYYSPNLTLEKTDFSFRI
ncbi:MAG TPA: glycosyltransferase family 2 protein, partial [Nitrospiria bacterium]|nr:glycosyltransferase family 2 protein [Nitrospiria bacterium]